MENEIAYLRTEDGFEFRLTNEKLFISSVSGTETFALRSINGIGVIDLIQNYNDNLAYQKSRKTNRISIGLFLVIGGCIMAYLGSGLDRAISIGGGIFIVVGLILFLIKGSHVEMLSSVRIMLNGMNRDFIFNKRKTNSTDVANFVARVEDTLTAFHKN